MRPFVRIACRAAVVALYHCHLIDPYPDPRPSRGPEKEVAAL